MHPLLNNLFYSIRKILLGLFIFGAVFNAKSAHLVGGEMNYRCLGNNSYEIKLKIYRDCNGTGAAFDPIAKIGIFNGGSTSLVSQLNVPLPGFTLVPINTVSSCLLVPPNLCIQEAIYVDTVTLLPSLTGYDIVYQRCCRNPTIVNIINPGGTGNTYHSFIPPNDTSCNSSPSFKNFPPVLLCVNDPISFDHSATDLDGDSLVYEFFTPYSGGTSTNPAPNPLPPPFIPVNWGTTFSNSNQVTSSPQLSINSATGLLTGTPTGLGQFVVGIAVKEYRNGVLLSVTRRDFQFNILNCIKAVSSIFNPGVVCNSYTVNFTNVSVNGTTYLWDFGDLTTLSDTSVLFSPTYTYPDTGVYRVRLIVDPYSPICSDTSYINLRVYPILRPFFDTPLNQCFKNNSFDFSAKGNFTPTTQINWSFGNNALPTSSMDTVQQGVTYSASGLKTVSIRYREFGCDTTYSDTIRVYKEITSIIDTIKTECSSNEAEFLSGSINASTYHWDFGVIPIQNDTSNFISPFYTYLNPGVYRVTLITKGEGNCADTAFKPLTINPVLSPFFDVPDNQCFKNNSFDFTATGNHFSTTRIDWDFGSNSSKQTSTSISETGISYFQSGLKNVVLRYRDFGCDTTFDATFRVYKEINPIFTTNVDTVCFGDEIPVQFSSSTDPSFNFQWDFGDGNTSTQKSPNHVYNSPGVYTIRLIASDNNCADTLTIPSFITVLPSPIASFSPLKIVVPGYDSEVFFTDNSKNYTSSTFYSGDGRIISPFSVINHNYSEDGYFYPSLTVMNHLGCKDSVVGIVFVKSDLFVPNVFTPNGDGRNEIFLPVLTTPEEYELLIFNRWGEIIFESNDYKYGWDGTNKKGELCKNDTYVYRIVINYTLDGPKEIFGHVNLLR